MRSPMASFLVLYGTGEGQTAKVADRIVEVLTKRGHDSREINAKEIPDEFTLEAFDAVLVGASIHGGTHRPEVVEFVCENRDTLAVKPTAFYQISLSSADEQGEEQTAGYVEEFIEKTEWHPNRIGLFGGALRYSKYGFLKRLMMKQIAKQALPDVDTSSDTEFTDWDEVEAFAADVATFVEGRLGVTPPKSSTSEAK